MALPGHPYQAPGDYDVQTTRCRGLGVFNLKTRAMEMLIHTFLSQAISPLFTVNTYYNTLYRWHVLEERDLPNPGCPPFYSSTFFSLIKDVHENTPLNVS